MLPLFWGVTIGMILFTAGIVWLDVVSAPDPKAYSMRDFLDVVVPLKFIPPCFVLIYLSLIRK